MIYLFKHLFLMTRKKQTANGFQSGYRVRLWKWVEGTCLCEEEEIFVVVPGIK
jgi:hypothetical protein